MRFADLRALPLLAVPALASAMTSTCSPLVVECCVITLAIRVGAMRRGSIEASVAARVRAGAEESPPR